MNTISELLNYLKDNDYCGPFDASNKLYKLLEKDEAELLLNHINNLQNRIDKAIEYIESHSPSDIGITSNGKKYYYTLNEDSVDNLLNILKGDDEN